jgi:thioredoxin-dependent peroxiredoxin
MRLTWGLIAALGAAAVGVSAQDAQPLKTGDKAPDFTLPGSDGKQYHLSDFAGKSAVVVAWFPKAFTGGWTQECNSLRDEMSTLQKYQVQVFAASVDTPETNKRFADEHRYNFPILSDPEKRVAKAYGVLGPGGFAQRWTFVIGRDGTIRQIDKKVNFGSHGKDLAAALEELRIPRRW